MEFLIQRKILIDETSKRDKGIAVKCDKDQISRISKCKCIYMECVIVHFCITALKKLN